MTISLKRVLITAPPGLNDRYPVGCGWKIVCATTARLHITHSKSRHLQILRWLCKDTDYIVLEARGLTPSFIPGRSTWLDAFVATVFGFDWGSMLDEGCM